MSKTNTTPTREQIINRAYRVLAHASGIGTPGNKVTLLNYDLTAARIPVGSKVKPCSDYTGSTYVVKGINEDGDVVLSGGRVQPYTNLKLEQAKTTGKTIKLGDSGRDAKVTGDGTGVVVGCTTFPASAVLEVADEVRKAQEAAAMAAAKVGVLSEDPQATWTKEMAAAEKAAKEAKKAANAAKPKAVKKPARRR